MNKFKQSADLPSIAKDADTIKMGQKVSRVWMTLLVLAILPFLLITNYAHPSIHDNYLTANAILSEGRVNYIIGTYKNWSGRYSELVLKAYLHPLTYQNSLLLEKLGAVLIILCLFASIYFLLKVLSKEKRITSPFATSLLLFAIFINGLSSVGPVFYWFDGYTAYTAGVVASLLLLGCAVALSQVQRNIYQRLFYLLGACIATIVAAGTYETVLLVVGWLLLTGLIFTFKQKQDIRWWLLLLVLVWLISAHVSLGAPGNLYRASNASADYTHLFSGSRIIISSVKSIYFIVSTLISWSNSLLLILGTIILLPFVTQETSRVSIRNSWQLTALLLWTLTGLSVCIFPSIFIYQTVWEHTWQCVYAFFLIGWVFGISVAFTYFRPRYAIFDRALANKVQLTCRITFLIICFGGSNSNTNIAYLDLQFRAPEYYQRTVQRTIEMKQAQQLDQVGHVRPIFSAEENYKLPKTLYTIPYNDDDVANFARYYGVDSVTVQH